MVALATRFGRGFTTTQNGSRPLRRTRTREVTGIDQGTKLNKALWILADEMRKLKSAA